MIAILALILQLITGLMINNAPEVHVMVMSPVIEDEEQEWREFNELARIEYEDEFTALFYSYNYKLSKNGRSMINGRFVKMGN